MQQISLHMQIQRDHYHVLHFHIGVNQNSDFNTIHFEAMAALLIIKLLYVLWIIR